MPRTVAPMALLILVVLLVAAIPTPAAADNGPVGFTHRPTLAGPRYVTPGIAGSFSGVVASDAHAGQVVVRSGVQLAPPSVTVHLLVDNVLAATVRSDVHGRWNAPLRLDTPGDYTVVAVAAPGTPEEGRSAPLAVRVPRLPSAPQGVSVEAGPAYDMATLRWGPPADDGGSPLSHYLVTLDLGASTMTRTYPPGTASVTFFVSGNRTLTHSVRAVTAGGAGPAATAALPPPTPPTAPTAMSATMPNWDDVALAWSAPASDGGAPLRAYRIDARLSGAATWTQLAEVSATRFTWTHVNAPTGAHVYRVVALNRLHAGEGAELDATVSMPRVESLTGRMSRIEVCTVHMCEPARNTTTFSHDLMQEMRVYVTGAVNATPSGDLPVSIDVSGPNLGRCPSGSVCPGPGFELRHVDVRTDATGKYSAVVTFTPTTYANECYKYFLDLGVAVGTASVSDSAHVTVCHSW